MFPVGSRRKIGDPRGPAERAHDFPSAAFNERAPGLAGGALLPLTIAFGPQLGVKMVRRSGFVCMGVLAAFGTVSCGGAVVSTPGSSGAGGTAFPPENGAAVPSPTLLETAGPPRALQEASGAARKAEPA